MGRRIRTLWGGTEGHQPWRGRRARCKPQELQRPHANPSSHPQSYSLDMAVVKSAVVLHLQRENISYDPGMQDSPTATMMAR